MYLPSWTASQKNVLSNQISLYNIPLTEIKAAFLPHNLLVKYGPVIYLTNNSKITCTFVHTVSFLYELYKDVHQSLTSILRIYF